MDEMLLMSQVVCQLSLAAAGVTGCIWFAFGVAEEISRHKRINRRWVYPRRKA